MNAQLEVHIRHFHASCELAIENALGTLRCDCLSKNVELIRNKTELHIYVDGVLRGGLKAYFNLEAHCIDLTPLVPYAQTDGSEVVANNHAKR